MRKIIIAVLISIVIISTIPLVTSASVDKSALIVMLTYPDVEYSIGDVVPVQAHVFRHSARFDPDEIEIRAGVDLRAHPVERLSEGLYEVIVEISRSNLNHYNNLRLEVTVNKSGPYPENDVFKTWLRLPNIPAYRVDTYLVDPTVIFPEAGQVIEVLVVCRYGAQLVDADPGSVRVKVDQYFGNFQDHIDVTRVSTGLYRGNWTVSVEMNDSDLYYIEGQARFGSESAHIHGPSSVLVSPIDVWINFKEISRSSIVADIYVHGGQQEPVEGARVSVEVFFGIIDEAHEILILETGPDGVANINLDLEDVEPAPFEVTLLTNIQSDGISHEAIWTVETDPTFAGPGFSKEGLAVTLLDETPVPAGSMVSLDFLATDDAEPLKDRSIECYIYTDHELLLNTTVRTDDEGTFELDVSTPDMSGRDVWAEIVRGLFKLESGSGDDWTTIHFRVSDHETEADWLDKETPDTQMVIECTPSPHRFKVTMRSDVADGIDESVTVFWQVGDRFFPTDMTDPGWYPLTHIMSPWVIVRDLSWNGEAYVGTIEVPDFLPSTVNISVSGYVKDYLSPEEIGMAHIDDLYGSIDNSPPEVEIKSPSEGDSIEGRLVVKGVASDDWSVHSVLVRVDGGEWENASGTEKWQFDIPGDRLLDGSHTIEAMSFDGSKYSEVHEIEIDHTEVDPRTTEQWPIIILLVLIVCSMVTVYLIIRKERVIQ